MEYIVGKPRIKSALFYASICIVWAVILAIFNAWQGIRIFSIVLVIIVIFIVVPGLSYSRIMWKVNEQKLSYTYHDTFLVKICAFFRHVLVDHHLIYQMNIHLNQIDYIEITYAKIPRFPYAIYGYDILFKIHTFSGSIYTFDIFGFSLKKEEVINAIHFMQKKEIRFIDRFHIIDELDKETPISYYLDALERGQKHD